MDNVSAHQFLMIYTWFGLTILVFLMALIARFYERLSGKRTYYQFFGVPVAAFAGATVRLVGVNHVVGDAWADAFLLVGGTTLAALCVHVYRLMTSGR
jgi:hypothetical protein